MYLKSDITGVIGKFNRPQPEYSIPSQNETDLYLLNGAKKSRKKDARSARNAFLKNGYLYPTNNKIFLIEKNDVITNINLKEGLSSTAPNRYKYSDINNVRIDFVDESGFDLFKKGLFQEKDRVQMKFLDYKDSIDECTTIAEVKGINFNYSI